MERHLYHRCRQSVLRSKMNFCKYETKSHPNWKKNCYILGWKVKKYDFIECKHGFLCNSSTIFHFLPLIVAKIYTWIFHLNILLINCGVLTQYVIDVRHYRVDVISTFLQVSRPKTKSSIRQNSMVTMSQSSKIK